MKNQILMKTSHLSKQNSFKINKLNYSFSLNLTTMKKQILLMVVAVFALTSAAFGQGATHGFSPRPLENCETGPLTPKAGVPYNYSIEMNPAGGNAYWFATFNNTNFITNGQLTGNQELEGGNFILNAVNYRDTIAGDVSPDTTTITWNAIGLAQINNDNPLFLAVNYTAPASGCANNLKVYKINPVNAFLVNIRNVAAAAYGDLAESCFSNIASASYNTATDSMEYNFGTNLLPFEVVSANFTDSCSISFRIAGLQPDQNANIHWSYTTDINDAALLPGGPFSNGIVQGPTITTSVPSTEDGVSIYVWLEVNNNNFEGLTDTPITLAVAGQNSANQSCVRWNNCGTQVILAAAFNEPEAPDFATHTLRARPTVTPGGGLNFINQVEP